jgi:hypothetical protein
MRIRSILGQLTVPVRPILGRLTVPVRPILGQGGGPVPPFIIITFKTLRAHRNNLDRASLGGPESAPVLKARFLSHRSSGLPASGERQARPRRDNWDLPAQEGWNLLLNYGRAITRSIEPADTQLLTQALRK